ncbi:MAG: hypothetical protein ACYDC5_07485 [Candidatus Dormibacteria bacterium]
MSSYTQVAYDPTRVMANFPAPILGTLPSIAFCLRGLSSVQQEWDIRWLGHRPSIDGAMGVRLTSSELYTEATSRIVGSWRPALRYRHTSQMLYDLQPSPNASVGDLVALGGPIDGWQILPEWDLEDISTASYWKWIFGSQTAGVAGLRSATVGDSSDMWLKSMSRLVTLYSELIADQPVTMALDQVDPSGEIPANRASHAAAELAQWLDIPVDDVMGRAGLAVSTYYHWRRHPDSHLRRSTGQRLFRIHAVVDMLCREFGAEQMRIWLSGGTPSSYSLMAANSEPSDLDELEIRVFELVGRSDTTNVRSLHVPSDEEIDRMADDAPTLDRELSLQVR